LRGLASHAPGGIGVFDAAMLVALWQSDKHTLLAGLLLFRLLVLCRAVIAFAFDRGGRELFLGLAGRLTVPPLPAGRPALNRIAGIATKPNLR
jgi:hypothetical protein